MWTALTYALSCSPSYIAGGVAVPQEGVVLDKKTFRALSSDTRINILKALKSKRMNVSEISRELGINKSAVLNHLNKMGEADLVHRVESENQFVYYELTEKGKRILKSELRVKIILSIAAVSFLLGGIQIYRYAEGMLLPPELQVRAKPFELLVGIALISAAIMLLYYSHRIRKFYREAVE